MKTATLNLRIDPKVKAQAEELYASFGINLTDAVNMFLAKSLMENGLPFALNQPRYNAGTEKMMKEAKEIAQGKRPSAFNGSFAELRKHLEV